VEARLDKYDQTLIRIAKVSWEPVYGRREGPALRVNAGTRELVLPLQGVIDVEAERGRLTKGAQAAEKERDSLAQRLANPNFTERAKPEAVEKARADHEAKAAEAERLRAALERLG
jgi:valyl-tRNA synthetase